MLAVGGNGPGSLDPDPDAPASSFRLALAYPATGSGIPSAADPNALLLVTIVPTAPELVPIRIRREQPDSPMTPTESGSDAPAVSVLFVCLGNICRSPLAEGVLLDLLDERGLSGRVEVDSAGTGAYHVGESPDPRSVEVARRNGIDLRGRARQVANEDLETFDYLVAMDRSNLRNLEDLASQSPDEAGLHLLREFDPEAGEGSELDVPDPYFGGDDGFDRVYEMIDRSCRVLLDRIRDEHDL